MELILIDDVFSLGKRGEIVRVADGYGRNYLLPKKLAIPATAGNRKMVEQQRLSMAKKEAHFKEEAELLAGELNQLHLVVSRKTGDTGTLFGSVTAKDITELLVGEGIHLDRRKLLMDQPLKTIGNHQIELRPHSEVQAQLLVSVVAEGDRPLARVKKKDEESDAIITELENKIKEIQQLSGAPRFSTVSVVQPEEVAEATEKEASAIETAEESGMQAEAEKTDGTEDGENPDSPAKAPLDTDSQ